MGDSLFVEIQQLRKVVAQAQAQTEARGLVAFEDEAAEKGGPTVLDEKRAERPRSFSGTMFG